MYRTKECVDEFEYKFKDSETGKIKKFKITEKRIVTFNPKLAKKQIYEINKEIEKAKLLKASQAKRSEYGDCAKYVIFTTADKKGNDTNGKIKVTMNDDLIKRFFLMPGTDFFIVVRNAPVGTFLPGIESFLRRSEQHLIDILDAFVAVVDIEMAARTVHILRFEFAAVMVDGAFADFNADRSFHFPHSFQFLP